MRFKFLAGKNWAIWFASILILAFVVVFTASKITFGNLSLSTGFVSTADSGYATDPNATSLLILTLFIAIIIVITSRYLFSVPSDEALPEKQERQKGFKYGDALDSLFERFDMLAFLNVSLAAIILGIVGHEIFHLLTLSSPSELTLSWGKDLALSVCCLQQGESGSEFIAYNFQFIIMAFWFVLNFQEFFKPKQ